ncbi:putative monooxygenase [Tothia fuscella]|uniref:Monooxygenase n=1 Tax=Tothia fuscella TaxID=1048955 RepID=A0A9P4TW51_9PEZI|nr:putative monooxygenase [Tothia fuscella]
MMATQPTDLHICIIGAGMGGLASALALAKRGFKNIDVYEAASGLGFVGAGIQLAPNMNRILDNLGVWEDIEKEAVDVKETSIRQGASDEELAPVDLKYIRELYSHPHMVGHRSSLAGGLYKGCKQQSNKIKFHFSTSLQSIQSFLPKPQFTVKPRNGEPIKVSCHVLLGSDGVKSITRQRMLQELGVEDKIVDTGQAAYRIMIKRSDMGHDTELRDLMNKEGVTRWIGEKRHIIAYPVSSKQIYNISTIQPDTNFAAAPDSTYTTKASKAAMLKEFEDFCPNVRRVLDLVPDGEVCEWRLRVHSPLPTWVHGSTALVGDACHPTQPHLGQGAAQAMEDAAVIAVVLSKIPNTDPGSIKKALKVYEKVRKERAETLVELAAQSGRALHLGEGKAKVERDREFERLKKEGKGKVPDRWADADVQKMIYGFDCTKVAEDRFEEVFGVV